MEGEFGSIPDMRESGKRDTEMHTLAVHADFPCFNMHTLAVHLEYKFRGLRDPESSRVFLFAHTGCAPEC